MRLYLAKKLGMYGLTFIAAVTINWTIPHIIPGDPITRMIQERFRIQPDQAPYELVFHTFGRAFRADIPLWKQYYYYWYSLFHADLGISLTIFPSRVFHVIAITAPYTLGLLIPAILLSWYAGSKTGALAARKKKLDNTVLPVSYVLAASPYMWIATLMSWLFALVLRIFPGTFAYSPTAVKLARKYNYRNAMLPQVTGLAIQLGTIMAGAVVTEIVFAYPGLGFLLYRALITYDYFLVQGIFLFIIIGVLVLNFVADIVCVIVDPRTRIGMQGGQA